MCVAPAPNLLLVQQYCTWYIFLLTALQPHRDFNPYQTDWLQLTATHRPAASSCSPSRRPGTPSLSLYLFFLLCVLCMLASPFSDHLFVLHSVSEVDLLASVRERYTTVKRLVVRSASPPPGGLAVGEHQHQHPAVDRNVLVEVQFTGPQPSEGPGALLCDLLCGSSVEAKPVELPRGRKKRARTDAASSEASDSGAFFSFFFTHFLFFPPRCGTFSLACLVQYSSQL